VPSAAEEAALLGNVLPEDAVSSFAPLVGGAATALGILERLEGAMSVHAAGVPEAFSSLEGYVSEVLSHDAALDRAFVLRGADAGDLAAEAAEAGSEPEAAATSTSSGLDLEGCMQAFEAMQGAGQEGVMRALATANLLALHGMRAAAGTLGVDEPHTMRRLLVTLLSPGLVHPPEPGVAAAVGVEPDTTPLGTAAHIVDGLAPAGRALLVRWLSRAPSSAVSALAQAGIGFFECLHTRSITPAEADRHCAIAALANDANEAAYRREGRRPIPFQALYSPVVSDNVDPVNEFRRMRAASGPGSFSFLNYPFLLSAAAKTDFLAVEARTEMAKHMQQAGRVARGLSPEERLAAAAAPEGLAAPYFVLNVNRDRVVEDTLRRIATTRPRWQLKKPLRVKFAGEAGIDEGGVRKEFFQVMTRQLFTMSYGMFLEETETNTLWFNHDSVVPPVQWELVGVVLGLAIYNGVILDIQFPTVVYRRLLGKAATLRDLAEFRPAVGASLQALLDYDADDLEDVMCLDFTATYSSWDQTKTHELLPGGAGIPVTQANKAEYVRRYVAWSLEQLVEKQFSAFKRGFDNVAAGDVIRTFRAEEMELLVTGSKELDFAKLKESAVYEEPYEEHHQVVRWMWEVVMDELTPEERRKFLAFSTGSARAPIRGLGSVRLTVSRAGPDSEFLPSAHTCFSHLLLPEYGTKEKLTAKLRAAINESEGFGLI